jgi:isochorismate hydrolase
MTAPGREVPIDPAHAALLIIDVQNYCTRPKAREIPSVQPSGHCTAEYPTTATRLSE